MNAGRSRSAIESEKGARGRVGPVGPTPPDAQPEPAGGDAGDTSDAIAEALDPRDFLTVGRIGRPHGIRGEARVDVLTDFPDLRFAPGAQLWLGPPGSAPSRQARVVSARRHVAALLVRFAGVTTREAAQELTGMEAFVPRKDAAPLPDGSFYIHDLIGLQVVGPDDSPIGRVTSFIETGATDVVVVTSAEGREHLVPLSAQIVTLVSPESGRMVIQPIPGLLD